MWVGGDERWFHISPRRRKQCVSYEQGTAAQAAVPQPGLTQRIRSGPYKLVSDAEQVETAASLRRALEEASLGHTSRPQANGGKCGPPFQGTAAWPLRSTAARTAGRPGGNALERYDRPFGGSQAVGKVVLALILHQRSTV